MIVRRLCVTPAVGSLMQWLLTSRNRTTTKSKGVGRKMSDQERGAELREKTQQLLQGPLKHVRMAALAAALLPLASVAATPASAQGPCGSGGFCGIVFNDANNNGTRDAIETGIEGIKIVVTDTTN